MRASQVAVLQEGMAGGDEPRVVERDEGPLLAALARGDRGAAEALVEASYAFVYASCHRLTGGQPDRAADLTQETYRRAWISLASFEGRSRFSTWLYRIAYNTWLNEIRSRTRSRVVPFPEHAPDPEDPRPDPHDLVAGEADAGGIRSAVLGLPEELRYTVTAHFWGELSVREIAVQEGVTKTAIRKRLKRAFTMLSEALEEQS